MNRLVKLLLLLEALLCPDRWQKIALFVCPLLMLPLAYLGMELQLKWLTVFAFFLLAPLLSSPFILPLAMRRQFANRQLMLLPGYRRYLTLLSQTGPLLAVMLVGGAMLLGQSLNSHWPALLTLWWAVTLYSILTIRWGLLRTILLAVLVRIALEGWPELQQWFVANWQQPWWLALLVLSALGLTVQLARVPAFVVAGFTTGNKHQQPSKISARWQALLTGLSPESLTASSLAQSFTLPGSGHLLSLYNPVLFWLLVLAGLQWTDLLRWPLSHFVPVGACLSIFLQQLKQASSRLALFWWFGQPTRSQLLAGFERMMVWQCLWLLPGFIAICWLAAGDWQKVLALTSLVVAGQWLSFYLLMVLAAQRRALSAVVIGVTVVAMSFAAWLLPAQQLYWFVSALFATGFMLRPMANKVLTGIDLRALLQQQRQQQEQQYVFLKSGW